MNILISGGGTGGHIFPAIAIAKALQKLRPDADILFVGAKGKMEMEKVPQAGFIIKGLWISGFSRSFSISNLLFPLKLMVSSISAYYILRRFRPVVVIGVGGFASGPVMRVASYLKIPIVIQEQNSYPGVTNRILAKKASRIFTAYPNMEAFFPAEKTLLTGNPVRKEIINTEHKRPEAIAYFELKEKVTTILVIGGSQGALSINEAVKTCLSLRHTQWMWQTGRIYFEKAFAFINENHLENVKTRAFIERMDLAYAAADIIISRAGAIAISELCIIGKPTILVPYPYAAANHQMHNARRLEAAGAAIIIKDDELPLALPFTLEKLLYDTHWQENLSTQIRKWSIPDADERIAREIIQMVENSKPAKP